MNMKQKELAAAIAKCKDETGRITPDSVIEQARNPRHPLHDKFNWNVEEAAMEHWRETARQLIKSVRFILQYMDKVVAVPYYVSDPRTKSVGYAPTVNIRRSKDTAMAVLNDELARIKGAIHRAIGLAAAFDLKDHFDELLKEVVEIETSLQTWPDTDEV